MWIRALLLSFTVSAVAALSAFLPQDEPVADFRTAHEQVAAGQPRLAAQTLLRSTLYVRQQVGRSRDSIVGMQLIDAESELERLATALRGGRAIAAKSLGASLARIDRVLAQHHVQMATAMIARPRTEELPYLTRDLRRSAFHFERTFVLESRTPAEEALSAITQVKALAEEIETARQVPKHAAATLAVLERQLTAPTVVAIATR